MVNYQTVVRNSSGSSISTAVTFTFTIHDGSPTGTAVFTETQSTTSNSLGLVALQIGSVNNLAGVNWGSGPKYLEVSANITGGGTIDTTAQLISVPYALYAAKANSVTGTPDYAVFQEVANSGNPPSTTLTNAAWTTRQLNYTAVPDVSSAISRNVANDSIVLAPGTYYITASAPFSWNTITGSNDAFLTANSTLRLWNLTTSTAIAWGTGDNISDIRQLAGSVFREPYTLTLTTIAVITSTSSIALQQFLNYTVSPSGAVTFDAGAPVSSGETEVYAQITIQKIH
jgi:hypothetical protein